MSVLASRDALFNFTYISDHVAIFCASKEMVQCDEINAKGALVCISGHEPSPEEAKERLSYFEQYGETPYAFRFKVKFSPEDAMGYKPIRSK